MVPKKVQLKDDPSIIVYLNGKSKVIKHGLGAGVRYAAYNNKECTNFFWWLKRADYKEIK